MNESFFALLSIGLLLIFYLCLRPFYLRRELQKMMTEFEREAEREEFPEFIDIREISFESENVKDNSFNFRFNSGLTSDTGSQNL